MSKRYSQFEKALQFVGAELASDEAGEFSVRLRGSDHRVVLMSAGMVFPRDVKSMAWAALEALRSGKTPVVVAEAVSDGARDFLRSQSIGYADDGGSLYLPFDGALVLVDRPSPKREKRVVRSALAGKTAFAVHALMASAEPLKGVDIARTTGLSLGGVSAALDKLDRMGWLATEGSGPRKLRRISDRVGLLEHWERVRISEGPVKKELFYVPNCSDGATVAAKLVAAAASVGIPLMASGSYGAQIHSPYLTSVPQAAFRVRPEDLRNLAGALGARDVSQGANLALIPSTMPFAPPFMETIGGMSVGSPLVCWLDTVAEAGRSRELAEHLKTERLLQLPGVAD